ncbi:MAG: hypothetical protein ACXW3U_06330 [Rhodoplanes sp.]|jgi:hypothetical protein
MALLYFGPVFKAYQNGRTTLGVGLTVFLAANLMWGVGAYGGQAILVGWLMATTAVLLVGKKKIDQFDGGESAREKPWFGPERGTMSAARVRLTPPDDSRF